MNDKNCSAFHHGSRWPAASRPLRASHVSLWRVTAVSIIAMPIAGAHADLIVDQSPFASGGQEAWVNLDYGSWSRVVESFEVTVESHATKVRWWGSDPYDANLGAVSSFTVEVISDWIGIWGAVIPAVLWSGNFTLEQTNVVGTGHVAEWGSTIYEQSVELDLDLPPQLYLVSIYANYHDAEVGLHGYRWMSSVSIFDDYIIQGSFGNGGGRGSLWDGYFGLGDMAYQLEGTPIPAPSLLTTLAIGGFFVRRRRRESHC